MSLDSYKKADLLTTMKSELLTSLQPALAKVSAKGVRPYIVHHPHGHHAHGAVHGISGTISATAI